MLIKLLAAPGLPPYYVRVFGQPGENAVFTDSGLKPTLLVCLADREVYGNPEFAVKIGQLAPRGEVLHYPGEHFDFYVAG